MVGQRTKTSQRTHASLLKADWQKQRLTNTYRPEFQRGISATEHFIQKSVFYETAQLLVHYIVNCLCRITYNVHCILHAQFRQTLFARHSIFMSFAEIDQVLLSDVCQTTVVRAICGHDKKHGVAYANTFPPLPLTHMTPRMAETRPMADGAHG